MRSGRVRLWSRTLRVGRLAGLASLLALLTAILSAGALAAPGAPTIDSGPSSPTSSTSATFVFHDDDPTALSFQCSLDGDPAVPCASPKSYSGLSLGSHTFAVEALDLASQASPPATSAWTIVAPPPPPPPAPSIDSGPAEGSTSSSGSASFAFSDSQSGVDFECGLDGGFSACSSPAGYGGLSNGGHTFSVRAVDSLGQRSGATSRSWTVNVPPPPPPPPTPTITAGPAQGSTTGSASASFSFSDGQAGVGFECSLDGAGFTSCTSPASYGGLGNGAHTFAVRAVDGVGQTSSAASRSWSVDTAPPPPTITSGPAEGGTTSSTSASFAFSDGEGGVSFQCSLDGAGASACTSPAGYGGLGNGSHTFSVRALDSLGNQSAAASRTWTVDTTPPPAPTITAGPADGSTTSATTASFAFSDGQPGVSFQCHLDASAFSPCTSPASYGSLASGTHSFSVKAVNGLGTQSGATSRSWTVDTTPPPPPAITSGPAQGGVTASTGASFTFTDGEAGVSFQCSLDGGAFGACASPKTYGGLGDGGHTFSVRAVDALGNVGGATSRSWTVDTTPPPSPAIASGPGEGSVTAATSATFSFSDGEAGVGFQCSFDGAAFSACTSPAGYGGLTSGAQSFSVRALDALGNTSSATTRTWTVDITPPPPPSIGSGPYAGAVTALTTAVLSFSDGEAGVAFQCGLDGAAFSACSSPAVYSGLANGAHGFAVRALDALGNVSATTTRTWKIDTSTPPPAPGADKTRPVFSNVPPDVVREANGPAGSTVRYTSPTATDPGNSPIAGVTCTPPSGATFPLGTTTVTCTASDAKGNVASVSFHVTIVDATAPVLTVPAPLTVSSEGASSLPATSALVAAFLRGAVASDIVDGDVDVTNDAPTTFPVGTTTVTFRAKDRAGNATSLKSQLTVTTGPAPPARVVDRTPPKNVTRLVAKAGDGVVVLRWKPPGDDFHHVSISRTPGRGSTASVVYTGSRSSYVDKRLKDGVEYRYVISAVDRAGNRSAGVAATALPASALLLAPRYGSVLQAPPVLRWKRIQRATYYNVQLYRGRTKLLTVWPAGTSLGLARQWRYRGRLQRLTPGTYYWFVWPGIGPRAKASYGPMLGQGSFRVR